MTFETSKPIYTAVLVPFLPLSNETQQNKGKSRRHQAIEDNEDLSLPLLDQPMNPKDSVDAYEITTSHKICNFSLGALIGIVFSVTGFHLLLNHYSLAAWSRLQVVYFALGWSSITGIVAYSCFMALHYYGFQTPYKVWERLEYYFAMGVFLGFCAACTATDVMFGLPLRSILLTLTVALAWALLMMTCATNLSTDDDDSTLPRRHRSKGTVLPMVMV
jgi:hypothetical protein